MSQIKKLTLKEDKELDPSSLLGLRAELKFTLRLVQLQSPCSWTSRSWLLLTFLESLSSQIKTLYPGLLLCCHLLPVTCWAGLSLVMVSSHLDLVLFFLFPSGQVAIKSWFWLFRKHHTGTQWVVIGKMPEPNAIFPAGGWLRDYYHLKIVFQNSG